MSLHRHEMDFVGHQKIKLDNIDLSESPPINNIIFPATKPEEQWIEEATAKIGDWRAIFRSSYIGWSLSINALYVAEEKYSKPEWYLTHDFTVSSVRAENGMTDSAVIARWSGDRTAKSYTNVAPMLLAHGVLDLFGAMEEFVFDLYRVYLHHNPDPLLQGDNYRDLRKLRRDATSDPTKETEWQRAWQERLEGWQRSKIYEGLDKAFLGFCNQAKIKAPSWYKHTTTETWAETIKGIAILRNCVAHGVRTVPKELSDFSTKPHAMFFDFQEGMPLKIELPHLQSIETFTDQLLSALDFSLLEVAGVNLPPST